MAGINNLRDVQDRKGKEFLDNLLNNYVIVNQNINGTFFGVKKEKSNDKFRYFKKSGEITYVDRMLMKYYNPAIAYFEKLSPEKVNRIPSNFFFGFEYVTKKDGGNSNFNRNPKNNLILSYIQKLDDNGDVVETLQTKEELERWAVYLDVEPPQIIFEGKLDDEQKTSILEFIYSPHDELIDKFKTDSFTKYILSILSNDNREYLKNRLGKEIEGIVFRFYDENDKNAKANAFLAKMIDPLFEIKKEIKTEPKKSNDYIWLIVIDLMNHIEMYNDEELREICEGEEDYDKKYIKLINQIYKDFIKEYSIKYEGLQLDIPDYLKRPEFEIEFDYINDLEIATLIKGNETYKEIYRIILNFFRKVRKKSSSSFFSPDMLNQLNIQIKKLKRVVMGDVVYEGLFPSFGEFIGEDISVNTIIEEADEFKGSVGVTAERVNVLIGSFQPINNGHLKAAEKLKEKNGLKVVLIAVIKKNKKYPFSERTVNILLNKVQQEHSELIAGIKIVHDDTIKEILKDVRPEFNPILWGTDSRKIKDYVLQLDYIKKKNIPIRLSDEFKLVELPIYQKADDLRKDILAQDYNSFKKLVPASIFSEFFNLNKELKDAIN
jgi:hypothetical protein